MMRLVNYPATLGIDVVKQLHCNPIKREDLTFEAFSLNKAGLDIDLVYIFRKYYAARSAFNRQI